MVGYNKTKDELDMWLGWGDGECIQNFDWETATCKTKKEVG